MRLLVDACMSRQLFEAVAAAGHDTVWVRLWQPAAPDSAIIEKAREERRAIITLDRDIPALVLRSQCHGPSVLRLTRLSTQAQVAAALDVLRRHGVDLERGALVTVSPRNVRVRRLALASARPHITRRRSG